MGTVTVWRGEVRGLAGPGSRPAADLT